MSRSEILFANAQKHIPGGVNSPVRAFRSVGGTCHAQLELAEAAAKEGVSYVAFGRFFNSTTKPGAPSADIALLAAAKAKVNLPIVAIGGVTLENAPELIAHGASMVAVVHGLFGADSADEVERRARAFSALFSPN